MFSESKKEFTETWSKVKFDTNAAVLTDDKGEPIGAKFLVQSQRTKIKRSNENYIFSTRGTLNDQKGIKVKVLAGKIKKEGEIIEIDDKIIEQNKGLNIVKNI